MVLAPERLHLEYNVYPFMSSAAGELRNGACLVKKGQKDPAFLWLKCLKDFLRSVMKGTGFYMDNWGTMQPSGAGSLAQSLGALHRIASLTTE